MLRTIIRNLYYSYLNTVSFIRYFRFILSTKTSRGNVLLGKRVDFAHAVIFQGRGSLNIADNVLFGSHLAGALQDPIVLQPRNSVANITIGNNSAIMNGCEIMACHKIEIGSNCLIGARTIFMDSDFHGIQPDKRQEPGQTVPIIISNNVWIGSHCIILKGVHIADDAVIAAGSLVTKNVALGEIVGGNPAKHIGYVYETETAIINI